MKWLANEIQANENRANQIKSRQLIPTNVKVT